ncbi:MAG TPA: hypothetical protein VK528_07430 [Flavobacterium sp.]|nr:hypothetical protein [Flavobacterium sp.]
MEKTKILTLCVIGLFLLNFSIIAFMFFNRPGNHPGHGERPREIVIERLHFDAGQQRQYDELIAYDRSQVTGLEDKIRQVKNKLYEQLQQPVADKKIKDSLIAVLAHYQIDVEQTHFEHFQHIKKLCRKDQLADFNQMTAELSQIFSHPPPPGR